MTPMLAWAGLLIAGVLEVVWAAGFKVMGGLSLARPGILVATVVALLASFYFLVRALEVLPLGTTYAVWTGTGAVGTAIFGILVFGESATPARLACIVLIVAGIAGLHLVEGK